MARRDAVILTPGLPGRFQFTQIHGDRGRPFRRLLLHQITCTSLSRDARAHPRLMSDSGYQRRVRGGDRRVKEHGSNDTTNPECKTTAGNSHILQPLRKDIIIGKKKEI